MWGCLKWVGCSAVGLLILMALVIIGGWWYLGSSSFAGVVKLRIEKTLESRLGRNVDVGSVTIERGRESRIIINGLKIANPPGSANPYFATVRKIIVTGGIDSFWLRRIRVGRVDIVDPHLDVEIYPAGSKLTHNSPHWNSGPPSRYEIYHLDLGNLYITRGAFDFLDRRHAITATANGITSTINVTPKEDLYAGTMDSPQFTLTIQDYLPVRTNLRSQFRFTPDNLALESVALDGGPDLRIFLKGSVAPLSDAVFNLHVTSQVGLNRIREIFKVNKVLNGMIDLDGTLHGKGGAVSIVGGWLSPKISADVYDLTDVHGTMDITGDRALVDIQKATYGGGNLTGHYSLPAYNEPYPMSADLHYSGVSLEKLFSDWGIQDNGLRGGATGHLAYHWNKDLILAGAGEGNATLAKHATAFSHAAYPVPLSGSTEFALDSGVVTFHRAHLVTDVSAIDFTGKFRIEDSWTDLLMKIHSSDFAELDRIGYNFAHSAGKKAYTLLGLGGAGDITGNVRGKIKEPEVVARITGAATKYNGILLGDSDIDLHYDGGRSVLTFDQATFRDGTARMSMTGTLNFPDTGPSPLFDIALDAVNYNVERAMQAVSLKLAINGTGTGKLVVTGTPDEGKVTFANFRVHQQKGDLRLDGSVAWFPGKGNTSFDLDIATTSFPVADIITFLDLGTLPVTGDVSGRLHLVGPKAKLEGSGQITIANGSIKGEPVTSAKADITFTQGALKATNVTVVALAGTITGEAQVDFNTNQFSYTIKSSTIDLSKLKVLSSLAGLLGGNITLSSTGAGTLTQPELVLEATLNQATLRGLNLPPDAPPPTLYIAIRNGQLIVRGSAAGVLTIEGTGGVAADGTLSGLVQVHVTDIAKALAMSPKTASLPAAGSLTANLQLGGKLTSIETVRVDATFPELNVRFSDRAIAPARPIHISLRDGRIGFDDFNLALSHNGSTPAMFTVGGFAELTGAKRLNIDLHGTLEAALLQLFVTGLTADGHIAIAGSLTGTVDTPRFAGTAEFQNASARIPGLPQMIDAITGTLIFRGDRIDIDSVRARLGGGQIVLGGSVALDGTTPKSVRVTMQGTEVAIRYFEGLTIEANFALLLSGDLERSVLTGDVTVNRALYFRDIDIGSALLNAVLSRRGVTPVVSASWQDHVSLRLHLTSDNTLAVRNNIADFAGSADIEVSGTLGSPVILGLVTLNEGGRIKFQDVDYRVVRGSINFQNPFRIDPFFDIALEARVNGGISEVESGPIDVTVALTGTIDRLTPSITSDPPASDITLFSLLGFGALTRNTATTPITASNAGRSLLFQSVSRLLNSSALSFIDSFAISSDAGDLDKTGDPGTKVSFEKQLSTNLRVLVIYNTRDSRNRVSLEWQVNPDWVLQFTRNGLSNEYDVEARFRRRYDGHWTWGMQGRNPLALLALFNAPATATLAPPITIATTAVAPPSGAIVTRVEFHADSGVDTSALGQSVAVRLGEPLSLRNVQSSVKSLFATGNFRDIRVDSSPAGNGVAVIFALYTNFRVSSIDFDGLNGADRDRAIRVLTFHLADVLSLNAVDHSAVAVQELLKRSGYLDATVDPETSFVRPESRAAVIFHVTRGTKATVGTVAIDGDIAPFTIPQLVGQMKRGPGKSFELDDARLDADRMRQWLLRQEYRKATVRYVSNTYDPATHTVALRYSATTGPVVKVSVTGVPARSLRGILPFRKNQPYSEDAIDRAAGAIVTNLQQRGYYNATVDTEESLKNNVWTSTFHVNPVQQFRLAAVTFTGNEKISDKTLQGVVSTSANGGIKGLIASLLRRPQGLTREQVAADRETLQSYYRLHGFLTATAGTPVVNTNASTGAMTVDFPVTEGPQTIVASVGIEGNEQVTAKSLPKLTLRVGEALNPTEERNDVLALQTYYSDRGNAEVQVHLREEVSADKTSARVVYTIAEGPKVALGTVTVRGNTYTNSSVVSRTAELEKGQPFSYTSILEAQQRLYRLGIFQRVDIQPDQSNTGTASRNVTITVAEGKDVSIAGALGGTSPFTSNTGANRVSPLVSASIAHRNLFGTGRYLGLELIYARPNRQDVFLTYREPFIGGFNLPVQVTAFQTDDFRPHTHLRQRGGFIEATRIARYQTRWTLRYEYRIAECIVEHKEGDLCALAQNAILPGLNRDATNVAISSVTPTFFWDKRDDSINPHRGFFTTASVEYAFPLVAANARFLKEFTQTSWYLPVSERSTFAVSGRIGLIQDLGAGTRIDPITGAVIPTSGVPLSERFTAGGDTSDRAYPLDLLGTACPTAASLAAGCRPTLIDILDPTRGHTIAPIGGRALFIFNAEYRFPVAGPIGAQVFVDAGNTFAETSVRFGDLRYGVGTGLRYLSPVGPIRFDLGYKLKRQILRFDENGNAVYEKPYAYFITLGYAF